MYQEQLEGFEKSLKAGFKPAVLLTHFESNEGLINKLSNCRFPRMKLVCEDGYTFYWFFKDKKTKLEFLNSGLDKLFKVGERDHQLAGKFLGYPPEAINYFNRIIGTNTPRNNIHVNYGGVIFASYPHTLKNDIDWLLENRPIPKMKGFKVRIGDRVLDVDSLFFNKEINQAVENAFKEEIAV